VQTVDLIEKRSYPSRWKLKKTTLKERGSTKGLSKRKKQERTTKTNINSRADVCGGEESPLMAVEGIGLVFGKERLRSQAKGKKASGKRPT